MRTDKTQNPDPIYIKEKLLAQLELYPTQRSILHRASFVGIAYGEIDNLQRVAVARLYCFFLIGAAINASGNTDLDDIDGMANNDPRIVDKTSPVRQLCI